VKNLNRKALKHNGMRSLFMELNINPYPSV
jgi:hypothetical protein